MSTAVFIAGLLIVFCFAFVLIHGAPYLPTKKQQVAIALDLLNLQPGQTVYDLGSGTGRFLIECQKLGLKAVGYELNPILYIFSYFRCKRYNNIIIKYGSFWGVDLSRADGVYVFLLDRFMQRLDQKLATELQSGTPVASYAFKIPNKKAVKTKQGVFLYKY